MSGSCIREEESRFSKNGITTPIHVLGGAVERQIPLFIEHDLTFTAPSVDKLKQINEAAEAAKPLQGPPQNRYRHGTDRNSPLQRRHAVRNRSPMPFD